MSIKFLARRTRDEPDREVTGDNTIYSCLYNEVRPNFCKSLATSGKFIVPVSGFYHINWIVSLKNFSSLHTSLKCGLSIENSFSPSYDINPTLMLNDDGLGLSGSQIVSLEKEQEISLQIVVANGYKRIDFLEGMFCGVQLG